MTGSRFAIRDIPRARLNPDDDDYDGRLAVALLSALKGERGVLRCKGEGLLRRAGGLLRTVLQCRAFFGLRSRAFLG